MKPIIKKSIWTIILVMIVQFGVAQKNKPASKPEASKESPKIEAKDSIPPMTDSTEFITNADILLMDKVIKLIMDTKEYREAGEPFTQHQILINGLNQYVVIPAIQRWKNRNKIPIK